MRDDHLTIRASIEALMAHHSWLLDHGDATKLPDLYVEDGRLIGIGPDIIGRDALLDWAKNRKKIAGLVTRHVNTNLNLIKVDDSCVESTSTVTLYRQTGEAARVACPVIVGDYFDIIIKQDGAWRFQERRVGVAFTAAS